MVHRTILTERQRNSLLALPSDEQTMLQHYVLSDEDLKNIRRKRNPSNHLGFALQLCALRYPGRYLSKEDILPGVMVAFIGTQLGLSEKHDPDFVYRPVTRYEHLKSLQNLYGFKVFSSCEEIFVPWLQKVAECSKSNLEMAVLFVQECRKRKIILPGVTVIERLCADARVDAERSIVLRISSKLDEHMKERLHAMLEKSVDGRLTIYAWLRRFEIGGNSADANKLMERLEYLQMLNIPSSVLDGVESHRLIWLRQQGEAYYADGLRDLNEERRLSILAVCAVEWKSMITDAVLETHERIVGRLYNTCKHMRDNNLLEKKKPVKETLKSFIILSNKLLQAHEKDMLVSDIIDDEETLKTLIETAQSLTNSMASDPMDFVLTGYNRFRRYTQRMLEDIAFEGSHAVQPLLESISLLRNLNQEKVENPERLPVAFAAQKWRSRLGNTPDRKLWEAAVLLSLRDALRSRDIWVTDSCKYRDTRTQLLPITQAKKCTSLSIPLNAKEWINKRKGMLEKEIKKLNFLIREGRLPNSTIDNGVVRIDRLERKAPDEVEKFTMEIYRQLPQISITEILKEVDGDIGFTDAFTHLHTGSPCDDKIGLLNVLLADGINMGLKKMAVCSNSHNSYWPLMRISQWHVNSESYTNALARIVEGQHNLSLSEIWGDGTTSSSDGQFFSSGGTGEAMNLVNARYGKKPGLKAYTHVSGQYAPFSVQSIPSTAHEAPYIIDGLTMNETGKRIKEHYADTGGFTDHVFALCALLGYEFAPRLRNISTLKLYGMEGVSIPSLLKDLIKAKASINKIEQQWPDIIRLVASIIAHRIIPSQILRQLASFPRENELSVALKEIGKIERTIFIHTQMDHFN